MVFSDSFVRALNDYFYLIERSYPARGSLKLVSDRYGLQGRERSMLYRGIFEPEAAAKRKKRLLADLMEVDAPLMIDGLNVLVIVASYLQGLPVFISNDGMLRDAAKGRKDHSSGPKLPAAVDLLTGYLSQLQDTNPVVYLDQQVPSHGWISTALTKAGVNGVHVSSHTDRELAGQLKGVLCTSDTEIIEHSVLPVFDLACAVLEQSFNPEFINLQELIKY